MAYRANACATQCFIGIEAYSADVNSSIELMGGFTSEAALADSPKCVGHVVQLLPPQSISIYNVLYIKFVSQVFGKKAPGS